MKLFYIIAISLILIPLGTRGQDSLMQARYAHARSYYPFPEESTSIRGGKAYAHVYPFTKGHQYLASNGLVHAKLVLRDRIIPSILLNYDIFNDILITSMIHLDETKYIIVNEESIEAFILNGLEFISVKESAYTNLEAGFYAKVYEQYPYKLLVRKWKERVKDTDLSIEGKRAKFVAFEEVFLIQDQSAFLISSKKKLLQLFANTPSVSTFVKQKKLKLNPRKEDFLEEFIEVLDFLKER